MSLPLPIVPAVLKGRTERELREMALRLTGPKRADPGRVLAAQQDAAHLPLFVVANEPRLL